MSQIQVETRITEHYKIKIVQDIGINILPTVLSDLNFGLRIFSLWSRILNRPIAPNVITTFLYSVKSSIRNGDLQISFTNFSEIIESVEIRTMMSLDQYNEFFDTFLPILTNKIFNQDNRKFLDNQGIVIIDTDKFTDRDVSLLSTYFLLLKDSGYIQAEIVLPHFKKINYNLSPYNIFDYYLGDSLITYDLTKSPYQNIPFEFEIYGDPSNKIIEMRNEKDFVKLDTNSEPLLKLTLNGQKKICHLPEINSIEQIFEEEKEPEQIQTSFFNEFEPSEFGELIDKEITKWMILQVIPPGEPMEYEDIFRVIGRYVSSLKNHLSELVDENRLLKRNDVYSITSVSTKLLKTYSSSMMDVSQDYYEYITNSRFSKLADLKFIQKKVRNCKVVDELIQWLRNLLHFVTINKLPNIYVMKCVALIAAINNVRRMEDTDIATYTISLKLQDIILDISEEIQQRVRDIVEEKSEDHKSEERDNENKNEIIEEDQIYDHEEEFEEKYREEEFEEEHGEEEFEEEELEIYENDNKYEENTGVEIETKLLDGNSEFENTTEENLERNLEKISTEEHVVNNKPAKENVGHEIKEDEKLIKKKNILFNIPKPISQQSSLNSGLKVDRPNEVSISGDIENGVYPSCTLSWSKIETEVYIVSETKFRDVIKKFDEKPYANYEEIIQSFNYFTSFLETDKTVNNEVNPNKMRTIGELQELNLRISEDVIYELEEYFETKLNEEPVPIIHEALKLFFVKPLTNIDTDLGFEELVLAITYASGAEGVHINTSLITNELPLNIKMWHDADTQAKKRLVIRKLGEKLKFALQNFRYNEIFVKELSTRLE